MRPRATRHAQPRADGAFTPLKVPDNFRGLTNHPRLDDGSVRITSPSMSPQGLRGALS
jgi:hypothetical protein